MFRNHNATYLALNRYIHTIKKIKYFYLYRGVDLQLLEIHQLFYSYFKNTTIQYTVNIISNYFYLTLNYILYIQIIIFILVIL